MYATAAIESAQLYSREQYIEVHFERPLQTGGFDSARCVLPSYEWLYNEGYSEREIAFFNEWLSHNAHTLFKYAGSGG